MPDALNKEPQAENVPNPEYSEKVQESYEKLFDSLLDPEPENKPED
ncbi:MAG: hypothetical protein H0X25_10385 [Acidobacteriales bacterium]|nr:hypothetical protein [Terriglobales bacterium]